jgi:hypothetical protein
MSTILAAISWYVIGFVSAVIAMSYMGQRAAAKNNARIQSIHQTLDKIMQQHGFTKVEGVNIPKESDGSAISPIQINKPETK